MKINPVIILALASVALAQLPDSRRLTEDSLIILELCERNALTALKYGVLFPESREYAQGYADALRDAENWLPTYLPREGVPFTPPNVPGRPLDPYPPKRGFEP